MQSNDSRASPLFSLPPEIRNTIYREVLVEGEVQMSATVTEPSLLGVNKQIRNESLQIYYRENKFKWTIRAFDAKQHIAWFRGSQARANAKCVWTMSGPRNWTNLKQWLKAFYEVKARGVGWRNDQTQALSRGMKGIVGRLFTLVKALRGQGLSWKQVETDLNNVHKMIGMADEVWEEEKDAK